MIGELSTNVYNGYKSVQLTSQIYVSGGYRMTGKVISFEGLDKSGKHSAMDFASELLEQKGYSVYKLSFPQYDTPIGQLIRQYLTNQLELTPKAFELLLAADKVNSSNKLNELLTQYDFI